MTRFAIRAGAVLGLVAGAFLVAGTAVAAPDTVGVVDGSQGIWYLRFYVGALAGEGKRFQIVEEVDDLLWIDPSSNRSARDSVAGKLRLLDIFEYEGDWIGSGTVVYGSGVFDADLEVLATGMVNMLNDTPIATDLPIHVESFDENGIRTRAEADEEAAGEDEGGG